LRLAAFTARTKFVFARFSWFGVSEMKSERFAIATSLSKMKSMNAWTSRRLNEEPFA